MTALALATVAAVAFTACSDHQPPDIDDDAQRDSIEADFRGIGESVDHFQGRADEELDDGHRRVDTIGDIADEPIDIDELIDGFDD